MNEPIQPSAPTTEQALRDANVAYCVREIASYPERLYAPDMAAIYRVGLKRFYNLAAEGAYDFALIKPQVGRQSWSRERVRQHFAGELRGLTVVRKRA